jgi:hypothetical protein
VSGDIFAIRPHGMFVASLHTNRQADDSFASRVLQKWGKT